MTYQRYNGIGKGNGTIVLKKDGTFSTLISGGCDGRLEGRGKWNINKDTLNFTDVESRMMDDPFKNHGGSGAKFLIKKGTLTAFSEVDGKLVVDENEYYKKEN